MRFCSMKGQNSIADLENEIHFQDHWRAGKTKNPKHRGHRGAQGNSRAVLVICTAAHLTLESITHEYVYCNWRSDLPAPDRATYFSLVVLRTDCVDRRRDRLCLSHCSLGFAY